MIGFDPEFSVSGAVAALNQTLEMTYQTIRIVGEISSLKISKQKWVYFDIKDDSAKLRCFMTVFQMPAPLQDGMQISISAEPRIHPQFGFTLTIKHVQLVGQGTIKIASDLLYKKLEAEGLFAEERKRLVPSMPEHIALITSVESAAYADFIKIIRARWPLLTIDVYDVQVQGERAAEDIVSALAVANQERDLYDVVVLIRGGGSADDLQSFSNEQVVRAVAGSRIPTCVAIGHEIDVSLAELAADMHASTPSNAAELLVPDKKEVEHMLMVQKDQFSKRLSDLLTNMSSVLENNVIFMSNRLHSVIHQSQLQLDASVLLLHSYHPERVLERGYAIVRKGSELVTSKTTLTTSDTLSVTTKSEIILTNYQSRGTRERRKERT